MLERPSAAEWQEGVIRRSQTPLGEAYRRTFNYNAPVLEDLLAYCGVLSPNHGATEHERGENDGRRKVGLYILHMMQFTIEDLMRGISGSRERSMLLQNLPPEVLEQITTGKMRPGKFVFIPEETAEKEEA